MNFQKIAQKNWTWLAACSLSSVRGRQLGALDYLVPRLSRDTRPYQTPRCSREPQRSPICLCPLHNPIIILFPLLYASLANS